MDINPLRRRHTQPINVPALAHPALATMCIGLIFWTALLAGKAEPLSEEQDAVLSFYLDGAGMISPDHGPQIARDDH